MNNERQSFESIREDIIAVVADLRAVARTEHDERRTHTADWLGGLFADVIDANSLREAAAEALTLYGGAGSFCRRWKRRFGPRCRQAGRHSGARAFLVPDKVLRG